MKLAEHDNSLETNANVKSQDFGIGDASVIIEILRSRMYAEPIRSLVQEYMSNARDGQREVNSKKRMVVSIPNSLSPVFKVRDFGPGINPDRMKNVFILYGASTKRGTNNQTGGFGIGSKSAWAYTDSFTIISITSGKKRTYVAHTGTNNQGRLDLLSTDSTSEESGVEINIAVKPQDLREFTNSIFRACYFWKKEERPEFKGVSAIDVVPEHVDGLKVGNLEIVSRNLPDFLGLNTYSDKCVLVIDGIPYALGEKLRSLDLVKELTSMVKTVSLISIGNGVVEVAASRESVSDSETTRTALNSVVIKAFNGLVEFIKTEFSVVKSNADWISTYHRLNKMVEVDDHSSYGDYKIERGMVESKLFSKVSLTSVGYSSGRRGANKFFRDDSHAIGLDYVDQVFLNDTSAESIIIQNKRIREYLEKNKKGRIILLNAKELGDIVDQATKKVISKGITEKESKAALSKIIKDFNAVGLSTLPFTPTVRAPPKAKRDRSKEMFTIHVCDFNGKHPMTTTLMEVTAKNREYLYVNLNEYTKYRSEFSDMDTFCESQGYTLCALSDDSIKLVSKGSTLFSGYEEWKKNFKPDQKVIKSAKSAKAQNAKVIKMLNKADEKIKCKHTIKMIEEYRGLSSTIAVPETIMKIISLDLTDFIENDKKLTTMVEEEYPLLNAMVEVSEYRLSKSNANELVFYINAKQ